MLFFICKVQIFILFWSIIFKLTTIYWVFLRWWIIFYFVLRTKISSFTVWSNLLIISLYVFFSIVMKKHFTKSLIWLSVTLIYWFWANSLLLFSIDLSHHILEKWLILGKLFDKVFNYCLKFENFLLKMFAILSWNLWLKLLNFHDVFHWVVNILKINASLLGICFEIDEFSLCWFFAIKAFGILINPRVFFTVACLACYTKAINNEAPNSFIAPLAMMKRNFVRLLHCKVEMNWVLKK